MASTPLYSSKHTETNINAPVVQPLSPRESAWLFLYICLMPSFIGSLCRGQLSANRFSLAGGKNVHDLQGHENRMSFQSHCVPHYESVMCCEGLRQNDILSEVIIVRRIGFMKDPMKCSLKANTDCSS